MAWMIARDESSYLAHHGIKGQKWGIRRFQNPDGSYTPLGQQRYSKNVYKKLKSGYANDFNDVKKDLLSNKITDSVKEKAKKITELEKNREQYYKDSKEFEESDEYWDAYKKAIDDAKEDIKRTPKLGEVYDVEELGDIYFYEHYKYQDDAYKNWAANNKSAAEWEKAWEKAYNDTHSEAVKITNKIISDKYFNKKVREPGYSSDNPLGYTITKMIMSGAISEQRSK